MEDTLVGFETAKLAKECGFNELCREGYGINGDIKNVHYIWWKFNTTNQDIDNTNAKIKETRKVLYPDEKYEPDFICTAPTQSLLQRWLREEHGLIISIEPTFTYALTTNVGYYAYVKKVNKEINTLEYLYLDIYFSATYEESLEIGLLEALKLI